MKISSLITSIFGVVSLTLASTASQAQSYPDRPVRIIVPYAAGGASDAVTRTVAAKLGEMWMLCVVVENRGGGGGNIGCEAAARSAPDGYTLLMATVGTHGINPAIFAKLPYDPVKDFEPVSLVASTVSILTVNPALPVRSVQELVAYAKANPGKLTFGSSGNGSSHHLAGEMLNMRANVQTRHVPYKGTASMMTDLLGGQIDMTFDPIISSLPHVKSGKLRALAVTSAQRVPMLPELPSMQEAGVPNYDVGSWYGLMAPAGTPRAIVAKISADVARVVAMVDVKDKLVQQGATSIGSTPDQLGAHVKSEIAKWAPIVKASGATVN
ncbi:MAG: tripartite tricarboxylate transporter substrate binding protein [Burkholderiaceae bacterium]|nr:tripartite tricarboxylate transporter substrate binding protein [Burkholderiaceae bacterium]